jgi:hypothetical protein
MTMIDTGGKFYLGRINDPATGETGDEILLYDPDDLTTHALVVGMTGSGKTGLCIDLLEEAALNNIPALMIDPKGDITNTLLHFPELLPSDFAPWVNADQARREGKSVEEVAEKTANLWRSGLSGWDIGPDRLQALKDSVRFAVYTPGSDAGLPISILASLAAPDIPWESNEELLREHISGTVTALLGLTGMVDIDPVQSREHILLANIFEYAWSQGKDLDLGELIMQTQSPPFEKLGFFEVDTFFPEKDRFKLAMKLNNIVAAPGFQSWLEGDALDIEQLLYDSDGRARHTIFYIAHLNDDERMFFVTLLFSTVETWMRTKRGTGSLRALIYFDEIFGYLPPVGNPPSKEPMLRMLKQARAFGVGLMLATQNPVDVDYKAMSNAGTWMIGKLATQQDKERLLDGLTSAAGGGLDRKEYDNLISALGKRVFLLRNVHEKRPALFQTRWAMNYLAGPVTRTQIPALNELAGLGLSESPPVPTDPTREMPVAVPAAAQQAAAPASDPEPELQLPGTSTRPAVPANVGEYFLPATLTLSDAVREKGRSIPVGAEEHGVLYRPVLLAQAYVQFTNRKYDLDQEIQVTAFVEEPGRRGNIRWEDFRIEAVDSRSLERRPGSQSRFASLEQPLSDGRTIRTMRSDFADWIYRDISAQVKANETLKVYAGPDVDEKAFQKMCEEAAEEKEDSEIDKLDATYQRKIDSVQKKLTREERELHEDKAALSRRKGEEYSSYAETALGFFGLGRKRSVSSAMSKRSRSARAEEDVEESIEEIAELKGDLAELREELQAELEEIEEKWAEIAADVSEIPVPPYKKDIDVDLFGVAWVPHYLVQVDDNFEEISAYELEPH